MVDHVYPITRNPRFSEVLRPSAFGPSLGRTALVRLFFLLPLLGAAGQTWQLRASLVELPGGVLVDPTLPNGVGFRGFTGLTLLTGEVARLSYPGGAFSAFYHVEELDGGAERFSFRLSDGRIMDLVRVPAVPSGRYHYLYRLDPDFFQPPAKPQEEVLEAGPGTSAVPGGPGPEQPEAGNEDPAGDHTEAPSEPSAGALQQVLYVGTMAEKM